MQLPLKKLLFASFVIDVDRQWKKIRSPRTDTGCNEIGGESAAKGIREGIFQRKSIAVL